MLDEELLKILACPACKGELVYDPKKNTLECHQCRLRYAVKDDVPIMLIEEAQRF